MRAKSLKQTGSPLWRADVRIEIAKEWSNHKGDSRDNPDSSISFDWIYDNCIFVIAWHRIGRFGRSAAWRSAEVPAATAG
jgi:hypothetical protein